MRPRIPPLALSLTALVLAIVPAAAPALTPAEVKSRISKAMLHAGGGAGAYVVDLERNRVLYGRKADVSRTPASIEKLFTTATALLRFGPAARLDTKVMGKGTLDERGVWHGNLYLRGSGDPTFGSARFVHRAYGDGATVTKLAQALSLQAGITRVRGAVIGDESYFDALRGGPDSNYRLDGEIGVLSALSYDRGLANMRGTAFQVRPAAFAARKLAGALRATGVKVSGASHSGRLPAGALELASVQSPTMRRLIALTNSPSDNFFAEMLLKGLGARFGGAGTTAAGAAVVRAQMVKVGLNPRIADGSGLSRADAVTPRQVVTLLRWMHGQLLAPDFEASLSVAGRTGTLRHRMRRTPAQGSCRGKTGTLVAVSGLAGYCRARDGDTLAFAFMMNGMGVDAARRLQDKMTVALSRYDGGKLTVTEKPAP